ncbi:alpha-amylase family glycosyl hydrolase [Bradyrhizobium sp. STM 3557]|uniref:alpha-amylase family glycosyl hydrolase n=1 Tax=Bradyrhizobium sp. STM 3557 TaxID=578920 RepID=UPI003890C4D0
MPSDISFPSGLHWWQDAVIYEIPLISFQDSDSDGRGDIGGLLKRLDYLQWLGVDAVWLTPIYPTPFRDFGYDISDYCGVDPAYGSSEDFDRLVAGLHGAGIRLIMDLVPNHTAAEHPWFRESCTSRDNPKADWYLWADPAGNGGPPNNWLSRFGGSAWHWHRAREQYYYHSFLPEQPDLNWRNPEVRAAISEVMRYWLERGVDGFRVDASAVLIKDALLRDNPPDVEADANTPPPQRYTPVFTDDRPETMACIETLRSVIDEYDRKLLCGEVQGKTDRIGHFYGDGRPRLHLPLNFALLDSQWSAFALQATIDAYYNALPEHAWPVWVIGGHDKQRVASKIGHAQARVLAMMLFTLRGTPIFYMGDELGMERVRIPDDRVRDPFAIKVKGFDLGRDPERAPLRWDDSPHGGFTKGEPWLPQGRPEFNVKSLRDEPNSILNLYRELMALRRATPCLMRGDYQPIRARDDVLAYRRSLGSEQILVLLNIAGEPRRWDCGGTGLCLLSTDPARQRGPLDRAIQLQGNEGMIIATQ